MACSDCFGNNGNDVLVQNLRMWLMVWRTRWNSKLRMNDLKDVMPGLPRSSSQYRFAEFEGEIPLPQRSVSARYRAEIHHSLITFRRIPFRSAALGILIVHFSHLLRCCPMPSSTRLARLVPHPAALLAFWYFRQVAALTPSRGMRRSSCSGHFEQDGCR
jgi:hypothetical protein